MLLMLIYDVVGVVDVVQRGLSSKEVVDFADVILLMLSMLKLSSKGVGRRWLLMGPVGCRWC
jgi:hypothetical protein